MDSATIIAANFTLKAGAVDIAGAVTYDATSMVATFAPTSNFTANTAYTVTIASAVKDLAGNAMAADKVVTFTTGDTTTPTVTSTSPTSGAAGVSLSAPVKATFSKAMNSATITSASFLLKQGSTPVTGTVGYSGFVATFTPDSLTNGLVYTATITTAVTDAAGNAMTANYVWSFTTVTLSGLATVDLGTAGNYVILAKTAVTNVADSAVNGDIGLSPNVATAVGASFAKTDVPGVGTPAGIAYQTSVQVTGTGTKPAVGSGTITAADMVGQMAVGGPTTASTLTTAIQNELTAYNDAIGRPAATLAAYLDVGGGTITGRTFAPGLYTWNSDFTMTDNNTISGSATDVWIFQVKGNLTTPTTTKKITLSGGALAKNIFWVVTGYATIGTGDTFEGIILAKGDITLETGATLNGRALTETQVILQQAHVNQP
jgi:hypothetical protein